MIENPYEPPQEASAPLSQPAFNEVKIVKNIRAICMLYIVFGVVLFLAGAAMLAAGDESPLFPAVMIPMALLGVVSAFGVLLKRSWGVPFCAIISAFYILSFPVGTILGGYFLLNIGKVKHRFR